MSFPKKKILLLVSYAMIILIYIPVMVLSSGSNNVTIQSRGTIVLRYEFPPSNFTYRIFQNSTSTYRISSMGFVDDHYGDPAVVINNALWNCSAAGGGSVYVVPDTYLTGTPIGGNPLYGTAFSNVYLMFGNGTIIRRTSGNNENDYAFWLINAVSPSVTTNFTLTSNGTAYFDCQNYANGAFVQQTSKFTMRNIGFEHCTGDGIILKRNTYPYVENVTVFSYDEGYGGGFMLALSDVQYGTFKHLVLDGNYQALSRGGIYLGDWDSNAYWDGTYFNNFSDVQIRNMKRTGIYLNAGALGWSVYNNTFTNCTIENNWQGAYPAIKLRPAQNNTFTDIVIRNMTDAVTTGTSYDGSETPGNCTGNSVTATIYGSTLTSLILTTDGNDQSVDHNFFNLTIFDSKGTYFSSGTNSPIHDNIAYLNFTNSQGGLYFEGGYFSNNVFVCNFSNTLASSGGKADIWFLDDPNFDPGITGNQIYVIAHGSNTFLCFTNGTRQNYVYYPWNG